MTGVLGDIKQQLGDLGKQMGQAVVSAPKTAAKTVASQVGFEVKDKEHKGEMPKAAQVANQKSPEMDAAAQKANEDFVKGLYSVSSPDQKPEIQQQKPKNPKEAVAIEMTERLAKENPNKSPEDIQKMVLVQQQLKQQLHGEYYQKLITPQGRPEEVQEEHEREAERMERLGMEELQEKKKKEEKQKQLPQESRKTEAPMGAG